jgi:multiple sugar transport system permease protein
VTAQARAETLVTAKPRGRRRRFELTPYLFILPHLIFFGAFLGFPFFFGIYTSLFQYNFARPERNVFVGLENYGNLFDPSSVQFDAFWRSLLNTIEFIAWSLPPLVIGAIFLAVLLNGRYPGRNIFRTVFFAPYTLSVTAASVLWWWIFQPRGGLINQFLAGAGLEGPNWLSTMPTAWIAITICTVWWTIGFNTVILLAALQEIPKDLYEAASIDGASVGRRFWHITLPMLRPVLVLVITITLIASANLFGQPFLMTAGGPLQETEPIMFRIYNEGIQRQQVGSAAAMSIFVATILLVLTALNFKIFGQKEAS